MTSSYQTYAKTDQKHHPRVYSALKKLSFSDHDSVLDLGCGDGRITANIARTIPQGSVIGLDLSPDLIEFAQAEYPASQYPNLSFQLGNAQTIEFESQFDVVTSFVTMHVILDHNNLLTNIRKALKPNGKLLSIFSQTRNDDYYDFFSCVRDFSQSSDWSQVCQSCGINYFYTNLQDYKSLLIQHGFKPELLDSQDDFFEFESFGEFCEFLEQHWITLMSKVPTDLQKQFIADIASFYLSKCPSQQKTPGRISYNIRNLRIVAQKDSFSPAA